MRFFLPQCLAGVLLFFLLLIAVPSQAQQLAFPGAEGFGRFAAGGRGGVVYQVTNLNDSGTGSLRACAQASGARTCVFRVSGTITLNSTIDITNPYLTIAGQTAPGGGIQLRTSQSKTGAGYPIHIGGTHDIIIRHIRSRPGWPPGISINLNDAIVVIDTDKVILDHVSMAWATDENLNLDGDHTNFTVQYSIMAEGLWEHSKGSLTCSTTFNCHNISIHHNLYISNRDRNPDVNATSNGPFEVINNVIHNPYSEGFETWGNGNNETDGGRVNVIGNTFTRGPQSTSAFAALSIQTPRIQVYETDNTTESTRLRVLGTGVTGTWASSILYPPLSMTPQPRATAYNDVLAKAGAWPRDTLDATYVQQARDRTGSVQIAAAGTYPTMASGTAPADTDSDGMPDTWETAQGLNPNDAANRNGDYDCDGYTNLEEYLNQRAADVMAGG